ncbi:MAG TPA: hypothetical protein DD706_02230 [Nitrospiraceae bacterium]|nr:hypothetical protein [Nitrospiraceae bacterium]
MVAWMCAILMFRGGFHFSLMSFCPLTSGILSMSGLKKAHDGVCHRGLRMYAPLPFPRRSGGKPVLII